MRREKWLAVLLLSLAGCAHRQEKVVRPAAPRPAAPSPQAPVVATPNPTPAALQSLGAAVKPYTVSPSFREVANYRAFTKALPLNPAQQRLLAKNLFVCAPTRAQQLFHIYEHNDYLNLPSFVTTDSVLQVYHVFYDFTLRTVEERSLLPALKRLTQGMLAASLETWQQASDPKLKQAALKNVAFFGVAAEALGTAERSGAKRSEAERGGPGCPRRPPAWSEKSWR